MNLKPLQSLFYITVLLLYASYGYAQKHFNIKHINPQFNSKNVHVSQISQDAIGNIWMATAEGILKYNGYSYTLIRNNDIFESISPDDQIEKLHSAQNQDIWIKTLKGLVCKYDSKQGIFITLKTVFKDPIQVIKPVEKGLLVATSSGEFYTYFNQTFNKVLDISKISNKPVEVWDVDMGEDNEFYVGTSQGKLFNYSLNNNILKELRGPFTDYPQSIVLQRDSKKRLWIGTEAQGLYVYDMIKKEFIQSNFFTGNTTNIEKEIFLNMFYDHSGYVWAGTDGGGLYKIDVSTGHVTVYKNKYPNEFSLSGNTIMDISEDLNENIWIVTNHGEVNVIPKPNEQIGYHKGSVNGIPVRILSVYKSSVGTLWIGTDGNGLVKIEKNNTEKEYFNDVNNNFYIQSITEDNNGNIWFGTYRNGLWKYDLNKDHFKRIPVINKLYQSATDVRTVFKDSKGRIWVGTNISLNIFSSNETLIASFGNTENGLNGTYFESILEDKNNHIWIGQVKGGLFKFKESPMSIENSTFIGYSKTSNESITRVKDMCQTKQDDIWFINEKFELNLFNTKTENFKPFLQNKALDFSAIISQDENNLWLSSTTGIHHFDLINNNLVSYYMSDGLQEDFHIPRSRFKDDEGLIYFGTNKGLQFFNPNTLKKTSKKGKLLVSAIDILNKPAKEIIPEQITSDVIHVENLRLKNDQSSFSVRFSAINNILNPNYYYYSYKLNGFDRDWKTTYSEGIATYTNIPPGNYELKIKAHERNQPSVILEKEIKVSIAHPFWKTPVAYIVYAIVLFALIFTFTKWYVLRRKLLINKISRRKEKELNNAKMNFFTKMSHEIQTPITLILSPIQDMIERAESNGNLLLKERLHVISNNAQRLSRIARELTLVRNKELKKLKLHVTQNNLYEDINNIALSFKELARIKNIDFNTNCPKNLNNTWYDKEKLEHILYNIVDNAFKFTPQEGNIQLNVLPIKKKQIVKISVIDSGEGITESELENIFKLFYRSRNDVKGMGIGLALTKELVDIHKGKIKVKSSKSQGTTFTVKIPVAEDAYLDHEKMTSGKKIETIKHINTPLDQIVEKEPLDFDNSKTTILIVEDNFELQSFLKGLFSEQYNVLLAENGKEGYYLAKNNLPDLIISDIMMPEMDGIELCELLLKNTLTKHIPIILLTAKNSTQTKITGLKAGAIEYINKPFNSNELLLKVNNILTRKEHIISRYRKELIDRPEINIEQSQDEIFLEHLHRIVNEKLNDSNFKIDDLAEQLNMSHSSLYRKCSTLTGLSLIDYIRLQRLKKAAILLIKYGYSISEVAYMVGFNNPKYFSKCFKNQYGKTPKDFCIEAKEIGIDNHLKKHKLENIN